MQSIPADHPTPPPPTARWDTPASLATPVSSLQTYLASRGTALALAYHARPEATARKAGRSRRLRQGLGPCNVERTAPTGPEGSRPVWTPSGAPPTTSTPPWKENLPWH